MSLLSSTMYVVHIMAFERRKQARMKRHEATTRENAAKALLQLTHISVASVETQSGNICEVATMTDEPTKCEVATQTVLSIRNLEQECLHLRKEKSTCLM